jgi:RNA polymerase sigma factor (sigma-70 family)
MSTMASPAGRLEQVPDPLRPNALEMSSVIAQRLPYFRRIAMRRLDNAADAEDAVQDAFLAAWKHLGQFKGQAQMSTWLTTIVTNSSRMIIRKRGRLRLHLPIDSQEDGENTTQFSEILPDGRPDPETQFRNSECEYRLQHLLSRLPPAFRAIIRMRSVEGLSIRETADALGLTVSAVKSRAARARAQLRRLDQGTSRRYPRSASPRTSPANPSPRLSIN